MAAIEVAPGTDFESLALAEFLAAQNDLGTKDLPRYVRVSTGLPVTGSGKVVKKDVKVQGWRTDDPVYRWAGRSDPVYTLMDEADKEGLRDEFRANGRLRFLP
jgi:fatty-acyl-CoA synthase